MTRTIVALLAVGVALGLAAPAADADRDQQTVFDATNNLLRAETVAARDGVLDSLRELGVDSVRIMLPWRAIAPSPDASRMPPAFRPTEPGAYSGGVLNSIDESIRGARARGMRVLLTPSPPIPDWASASADPSQLSDPDPAAFERLLIALGRRYDGNYGSECTIPPRTLCLEGQRGPIPRVELWSIWNEPNQSLFLRPQRRGGRPYSPRLYRQLFLAAQRGLAATGHGGDVLLIGETAPSGGRDGVDPLDFIRGVLCLDRAYRLRAGCAPISADGWAHHPYSLGGAPYRRTSNKGLINLATIGRMIRALNKAERAGATSRRLPVYATEYGVQTRPAVRGVGLVRQAEYIGIGEYLMWRNPQLRSYAQYLLADDRSSDEFAFRSGLITDRGAKKPSYAAFPITLVARRSGRRLRIWGHVRPDEGPHSVQVSYRRRGGRPHLLRTVRTNRRGYFSFKASYRAGRRWAAACVLPGGRQISGPYVGAFSF